MSSRKEIHCVNNTVSAAVITHNEEINLRDCLDSIQWVYEIIVVDSYSTDHTIDIAKKYTSKIFYKRFENDFSEQRNFALSHVSPASKWILVLDADEKLSENSRKIIMKLIRSKKIEGYWFPRRNYINANTYLKYGLFYPDYQLRLFANKKTIKYKGVIHEELTIGKSKTQEINELWINHNSSHTKYDSFKSLKRLIPYIKIESGYIASTNEAGIKLFFKGLIDMFMYFFNSFIRGKGYNDGFLGFRAAVVFSLYRGFVSFFAIKYKKNNLFS